MRHLFTAACLFTVLWTPASAQDPVQSSTIAWTQCLGGRVTSYVNAEIVGTDSMVVILRHEEVHRRQANDSVAANNGECIYPQTPAQLLNIEIEAYCASDSVEVAVRKRAPIEVSAETLGRLIQQFHRALPLFTIATSWSKGCP